ncbi:MAG: hypothetical protein GXP14_11190 [Gammaproteobacteria bacterium]|nr:hypothetical protein [Gammaproteobacteria bacterium]
MNIPFFKTAAITTCAGLALVACGGDGGSDDNSGGDITLSEPLAITSENAAQVSGFGVGSPASADTMLSSTGNIVGGVDISSKTKFSFRDFAKKQLESGQAYLSTSTLNNIPDSLSGVEISETVDCTNSGSMTISGNIVNSDSNFWSKGDSLSVNFDNCSEGSYTINGAMSFTLNTDENDESTAPYNNSMSMIMNNLSIVPSGEAPLQAQGDMTISSSSDDGIIINSSISGTNLSFTEGGVTETLTDYQFDLTDNQATGEYSENIKATIDINQLGGRVACTTLTLFEGVGESNPHTGILKCVGANQSSVTLTAIDNTKVTLDIDTDGDGITDETQESTWAEVEL